MVSTPIILSFVISAICMIAVPAVVLIVLGVKRKISGFPLLVGAGAFFLSQLVLRIPLLDILSLQGWFQTFEARYFPYVLVLAFSAGLFEESARLGGAVLLKKKRSFKDIISFGLGHAFCEAIILLGLAHVNNIILCVMINNGEAATIFPAETLDLLVTQLAALNPMEVYLGILERLAAVVFHLFATLLVFTGVKRKKIHYYFLALLAHTGFNLTGVLLARFIGVIVAEIALLLLAVAMGYYVIKHQGDEGEEERNEN